MKCDFTKICVTVKTESPALGLTSLDSRQSAKATTYSVTNVKISETESRSVVPNSLRPYGLYSPWNSLGQNAGVGSLSLLQGNISNLGIEPRFPALQADSLPTELGGKPLIWYVD